MKPLTKAAKLRRNYSLRKGLVLLCLLFLSAPSCYAVLPDFVLNVTKTDESCTGNGTLSFTVSNTDPLATIEYTIYKLPDLTNPIVVTNGNTFGGLTAGNYRVIAVQSLNGESNSQSADIEIENVILPMTYSLSGINATCGNDGSIIVNVTLGTASLYEIISGPVILPPQTSPVLANLAAGVYLVRVFDTCGEGFVQSFTLFSNSAQINISALVFPSPVLPDCNSINVANTLTPSPGDDLTYPLYISYSVFPPGGGTPTVITSTLASGATDTATIGATIPFYNGQQSACNITVTDHCGNVFTHNDTVNQAFTVNLIASLAECGTYYLMASAVNYVAPLTVSFASTPTGFDPVAFNPNHPGPFSVIPVEYGNATSPVPYGTYSVSITDSCGRTDIAAVTIDPPDTEPTVELDPYPGCTSTMSIATITIPPFIIESAVMTLAPAGYPQSMPYDVTQFINADSELVLEQLITGNYIVHLIDTCGNEYDAEFFVPISTSGNISSSNWPDCSSGNGSIRIAGNGTTILYVEMLTAPSAFTQSLPLDVSYNILAGTFTMDNLPPGAYSFLVNDSCGVTHPNVQITVIAYVINQNEISQIPHCGSFDLSLFHSSTGISEDFWLQKFFPSTNSWGHPQTGAAYIDGTVPNPMNSYPLINNTINYNIGYTGSFRVIKALNSFESGSEGSNVKTCIEIIEEFDFNDGFQIIDIEKLTCDGQNTDLAIITKGVPPLTYKITSKNGDTSFVIDNGNNNVFTGLEVAVYEFEVQHACGHIRNIISDIGELPSPVVVPAPQNMPDMVICDDESNDGISEFILTTQDALILGTQNPANYTISYHLTSADANSGANPLPAIYTSTSTTIYARLLKNNTDCYETTSFDLVVNPFPVLQMSLQVGLCEGESVTITADSGFTSYNWSTGATSQSITVNQSGDYTLTVSNGFCETTQTIHVTPAEPPVVSNIEIHDWTDTENTLTVILQNAGNGNYLFSLDNVSFQTGNIFNGLLPGAYTVFIKEASGCGVIQEEVYILMYPKYFTPNGDGTHDFWRVKFSELEPNLKTYVFDRYGKLITGFMPDSQGWDGNLNGQQLPSTDYWFVVVRENGKELRGHFAMKR